MNAGLDASHGASRSPWRDRHEFTFTLPTALHQFLALGVRLYFPLGFAALVGVSIWFARQQR
ncbi:MAG: hypothetical protein EOS81_11200 [Mesorhizobium sp.]|uniref:hypothetical protein n=1 Tax=Mesorhizobium sp. TaxID=1871066 RepID=UPI000F75D39F|nr:hypothetical protein [Mesorhizobium sp.]AZO38153.1 hypothetical protein EJ072_29680 [Mesorhizobium sp. M2A.F.Ca.ET.046.03.2.1]RUY01993.1 hypothetical protein EOA25_22130 [Mesorhizobium sp. M2A.F.Ca.ET.040.01.1.1]RVC61882.1 hypothetical protein EN759_28535 [Mesorhizobium sp. M00.F.Ca.ET.038.03.1.1]RVC68929.1 hypothetical protein EN766_29775 [Mesorhizobium sp. M2A.F.Ca.ET.046.02.1.1]RWX66647.1 hypothetical protein EOA24_17805 [Mesorhizobium sp. M2A.F.Ca.ET.039.01.1.1]